MAFDLNQVVLFGRLTRDPELRMTSDGKQVCSFSIANNRGNDPNGVSFFECTAFDRAAENISKFFAKGRPIIVVGRLRQERWNDKSNGEPRSKVTITITDFHFLPGRQEGEGAGAGYAPSGAGQQNYGASGGGAAGGGQGGYYREDRGYDPHSDAAPDRQGGGGGGGFAAEDDDIPF